MASVGKCLFEGSGMAAEISDQGQQGALILENSLNDKMKLKSFRTARPLLE